MLLLLFLFLDPFLFSDLSLFLSNFFISTEIFYCKQTTSCTINVKKSKELQISNIMYKKTMTFCLSLIRENWTNHFYLQAGNKGNILPTPKIFFFGVWQVNRSPSFLVVLFIPLYCNFNLLSLHVCCAFQKMQPSYKASGTLIKQHCIH